MTEKPEASVLTARRAAQHFRLSSADDACEHLYILIIRSSLGPSPPNAGRYTVASRFRCRSCERGYIFPRAPERFVTSPLCLVGYARWDARSDRVPPLQTIIFSSFTGRTKGCRPSSRNPQRIYIFDLPDRRLDNLYSCNRERQAALPWPRPLTVPPIRYWKRVASLTIRSPCASCVKTRRPWLARLKSNPPVGGCAYSLQ